jgi:hypothetical protein
MVHYRNQGKGAGSGPVTKSAYINQKNCENQQALLCRPNGWECTLAMSFITQMTCVVVVVKLRSQEDSGC